MKVKSLNLNFEPFPVLESSRLRLRKILPADAKYFFQMRSDPEVMKYIDKPMMKSAAEAKAMIRQIEADRLLGNGINWGITLKEDLKLIGTIGFWRIDKPNYRTEVGYMLQTKHQGKGLVSEALQTVLDFAFNQMHVHSIEANINPFNDRSRNLLIKNGFIKEAYFRENYFYNGKFLDSEIYSLIRIV
ncbi:MAG: GNAT family N-acetyltransferase [Saprospiraceae bacterium]|nr:GNAT family N-acetyltransferase [Candidatus Vicinibacter proximus]HRG34325.1 GNAT family N-acetyltransferase [Saprospiraceae bacterium]